MADPALDAAVQRRLAAANGGVRTATATAAPTSAPTFDLDAAVQKRLQRTASVSSAPASAPIENIAPPMPRPAAPTTASYDPPPDLTSYDNVSPDVDQNIVNNPNYSEGREWLGHVPAGLLDATIGQLPTLAALPAAIYNTATRDEYPEEVNIAPSGWKRTYDELGYNLANNAKDERRYTDMAREAIYDADTWVGEQYSNYGPEALSMRLTQAMTGNGGGFQEFNRDVNAVEGEVGYVSPAQEIIPEAIAAAIPSPLGKAGLVQRVTSVVDDVPRLLQTGAKIADGIIDNFVLPFSSPGKVSQASNAAISAGMTEGQRYMTGEDTLVDWSGLAQTWDEITSVPADNMSPQERLVVGVQSSGINGYNDGDLVLPGGP